jgi:hypothetical protein
VEGVGEGAASHVRMAPTINALLHVQVPGRAGMVQEREGGNGKVWWEGRHKEATYDSTARTQILPRTTHAAQNLTVGATTVRRHDQLPLCCTCRVRAVPR